MNRRGFVGALLAVLIGALWRKPEPPASPTREDWNQLIRDELNRPVPGYDADLTVTSHEGVMWWYADLNSRKPGTVRLRGLTAS